MALVLGRLVLALIFALCFVAAIAPRVAPAADVTVILDQAKLIKLPEKVATIVIGNPLIADASLQPGGLMVVTGKGYGTTNLVVLDRAGAVLMEKTVEVQGPRASVVVVYRGIERRPTAARPTASDGSRWATVTPISPPRSARPSPATPRRKAPRRGDPAHEWISRGFTDSSLPAATSWLARPERPVAH